MEKETPFLFTDLVPPGEVYVPDESETIPIRTWSRGDPFQFGDDCAFPVFQAKTPVGESISTDGMLHYQPLQPADEGNDPIDEGEEQDGDDGDYYDEGDDYEGNDAEYHDNNEGGVPEYAGLNYNDVEKEYDSYYNMVQGEHMDNETGEEADDDEYESDGYEEEENGGGEDDDQVNCDEDEADEGFYETGSIEDAQNTGFVIDAEHFEKVTLSPRELELVRSSAQSGGGEFSDLMEIMNEYNELVDYLTSPRNHPAAKAKQPKPHQAQQQRAAAQAKMAIAKGAKQGKANFMSPSARGVASGAPSSSRDQDSEDHSGDSDEDDDGHSASQQALLAQKKLSIMTGMVSHGGAGAGVVGHSGHPAKQGGGKPAKKGPAGGQKKKKKLFGQALEDHKRMLMQNKVVGRTEVDEKQKVRKHWIAVWRDTRVL
jgi:hypothetical protein